MKEKKKQLKYYKKILIQTLSFRQSEKLISNNESSSKKIKKVINTIFFENDIEKITQKLKMGVKVSLKTKNKGSVLISFNNIEEYNKIIKKLSSDK